LSCDWKVCERKKQKRHWKRASHSIIIPV
jgi:hypothetical protein